MGNNKPSKKISKTSNPQQITRRIAYTLVSAISTSISGYAGFLMGGGNMLAPWLLAVAALLVAMTIITTDELWGFITRRSKKWQVLLIFGVCVLFTIPTFIVFNKMAVNESERLANIPIFNGYIVPGNGANPVSPNAFVVNVGDGERPSVSDNLTIMFGERVGAFVRNDQPYIIAQQGNPIISVWFDVNGAMLMSADIYAKDNKQVLKMVGSQFYTNPFFAFNVKQPNYHTLVVNDSQGNEVFNVDYINPNAMRFSGRFYIKGYSDAFTISPESSITFDGLHVYEDILKDIDPQHSEFEPFMFDITTSPDSYFIDITEKGGVRLGGRTFGEGTGRAK